MIYESDTAELTIMHRPVTQIWDLLSAGLPLVYTPTESETTLRLTLKTNNAQNIDLSAIYHLTLMSLADIATSTAMTNGNGYIRHVGQKNSTYASSYQPSRVQFMVTATSHLPIHVVTDTLRAMQELTHYLYFLDVEFEVFSHTSPTNVPLASGCLALDCGFRAKSVQSRDLEYANGSATNFSAAPSRRLQSSSAPIQLVNLHESEPVAVTYEDLQNPLPIHDQSFVDVADRILANITDLIIANKGDGPLPFFGRTPRRLFHYEDTWGSNLGISLLPYNPQGNDFTLYQAAMALKAIEDKFVQGPMVESKLRITVDGSMVGWGCLRYTNTSAWRCLMPTAGTTSSVGSGKDSALPACAMWY